MLTGAVGCALFVGSPAHADPLFSNPPLATVTPGPAPAVDGFNEKFDAFGGSIANRTLYGTEGSLGIPLAGPYGCRSTAEDPLQTRSPRRPPTTATGW